MMANEDKADIFIAFGTYDGGVYAAQSIFNSLRNKCYSVSFSEDNFPGGNWKETIARRIDSCNDFIVILSNRTFNKWTWWKKDILKEEIIQAIEKKKRIIPIILPNTHMPPWLPKNIRQLLDNETLNYRTDSEEYEVFINKLTKRNFLTSKRYIMDEETNKKTRVDISKDILSFERIR